MQDTKQKVLELVERLTRIKQGFNLAQKEKELTKLEEASGDPHLWDNQENARKLMQELDLVKSELDELKRLDENVTILQSFATGSDLPKEFDQDLKACEAGIEKLEIKSFLSGPYDKKSALISIHSGQGGVEAMDWAGMLYRMYLRYAEKMGFKSETLDLSLGEEAGYKSITFKIEAPYAYGHLKGEAGTHRLVRQSPFNADSLRQTSFALVEVLPELEKSDLPHLDIKDSDLEWQFYRASSQGGQNVQKVSTAVRLKHLSSGIVVTAQTERFQEQNRKIALSLLRAKLWVREEGLKEKKVRELKGEYRPASWGNQIRSYVLHPYKLVKDLRTGAETANAEEVLDGDLGLFIEAQMMAKTN